MSEQSPTLRETVSRVYYAADEAARHVRAIRRDVPGLVTITVASAAGTFMGLTLFFTVGIVVVVFFWATVASDVADRATQRLLRETVAEQVSTSTAPANPDR